MEMSYIDVVRDGNRVICWTRDVDGELSVHEEPVSHFCYLFMLDNTGKETLYQDLYGRPVKRIDFNGTWEMNQFTKQHTGLYESDIQSEYKFLHEYFHETNVTLLPNVGFYDIEVDFDLNQERGYPLPEDPFGEINSISLFDTKMNAYVMFMLTGTDVKMQDKKHHVKHMWFDYERELLESFCDYIDHIDILAGWNTDGFDLPYIMERLKIVFGEKRALSMLCRNGIDAKRRDFTDDYGKDAWEWTLAGRAHLDMMKLFKKFIPKQLESFSLSNVCMDTLGIDKIDYDGDLGELYREDPQLFFEYSLHDSRLLLLLNNKFKLIEQCVSISRDACVRFVDVCGTVKVVENNFLKFCRMNGNYVLPDRTAKDNESFEGAIVYDTITGLHNSVFSVDLRSLYPFTMIMLGQSPETMIMQCIGKYDDYVHVMTRDDSKGPIEVQMLEYGEVVENVRILPSELESIIREEGYVISAYGTIFSGELGLLSAYAKSKYDLRAHYKGIMKDFRKAGDSAKADEFDLKQSVTKILLNSIYGCSGTSSFRLFDVRLSASTTLSAQIVSKQQIWQTEKEIDRYVEEYLEAA